MYNIFQKLAGALSKPGKEIIATQTAGQAHLTHMALGVAGESGELVDAIKKHTIYGKPIDRENVKEEIADLRFYLAGIMNELHITEGELSKLIEAKLGKRYSAGSYSNEQAQARADKAEASK